MARLVFEPPLFGRFVWQAKRKPPTCEHSFVRVFGEVKSHTTGKLHKFICPPHSAMEPRAGSGGLESSRDPLVSLKGPGAIPG